MTTRGGGGEVGREEKRGGGGGEGRRGGGKVCIEGKGGNRYKMKKCNWLLSHINSKVVKLGLTEHFSVLLGLCRLFVQKCLAKELHLVKTTTNPFSSMFAFGGEKY